MGDEIAYDEGDDFDDDWLYMEDEFSLADELAESAVPDPGYAGTNYEVTVQHTVYDDLFQFWDDLEYGFHEYWDYQSGGNKVSTYDVLKQMRTLESQDSQQRKRRRLDRTRSQEALAAIPSYSPIIFMSPTEREDRASKSRRDDGRLPVMSLFVDWRTRFVDHAMVDIMPMPAEMQKAAKTWQGADGDDETPTTSMIGDETPPMNGNAKEEGGVKTGRSYMALSDIDGDALRAVFAKRLEEAGIAGAEGEALLQGLTQMCAGDIGEDELVDTLTKAMLTKSRSAGGNDMAEWLSRQGVNMDDDDDEEEDEESEDDIEKGDEEGAEEDEGKIAMREQDAKSSSPTSDTMRKRKR